MIRLEAVTKRFAEVTAVDDLSLEVRRGEIFGFLGPNGAGKSTTIHMLTTLLKPTEGRVLLADRDVYADPQAARKLFGIVFQESSLDHVLTCEENMDLHGILYGIPRAPRRSRTEKLLKMVDLWQARHRPTKTLSGGMRRRLEIARGLMHQPEILFLDEPTLGLDVQTRRQLWSHVVELNAELGTTVFFTTHYLDEADRVADRVAIVKAGKLVGKGSPSDLKSSIGASSLENAYLGMTGTESGDLGLDDASRSRMIKALAGVRQ